jgi:hypothetical protein
VHLADRRGRERSFVEAHEDIGERSAKALLDDDLDLFEADRRNFVLELLELGDEIGREDVAAGRDDLPELDERRTEILEDEARANGERDLLLLFFALRSLFLELGERLGGRGTVFCFGENERRGGSLCCGRLGFRPNPARATTSPKP